MTRRRTFGSIRRLPSGRYQVRYPGPDGLLRRAPDTFETKPDAGRYLAAIETDMVRGVWTDPQAGETTLREYADAWISERRVKGKPLSPRTIATYRHSLDAWILPTLGEKPLSKVTPSIVRRWHAEVSSKTGPTATRQAYSLLRAIMHTAVADEVLHRNPCRIRGAGQPTSPERPLLDPDDVARLASAMPEGLQATVLIAFWAHLRIGEVLGLQRRDVDLAKALVSVERQRTEIAGQPAQLTEPKLSSKRVVHLPEPAVETLRGHLARLGPGLPTAPLFRRPNGKELGRWHLEWYFRQAREHAGLPKAHFHDLRHAGLTLSAQVGATLAEVMRRAGHASSAAALRYQHAAERRDAEIAARLSEAARSWRTR